MRTTIPSAIDRSGPDAQHTAPGFAPSAMRPAAPFAASESAAGLPYRLQGLTSNSARVKQLRNAPATPGTIAEARHGNGLPLHLQSGIEALSGLAMDDVTVHYNSSQPAQVGALAYAQGRTIYLGPGQETHLPHEAWHVVQQAQGRVKPNRHLPRGAAINDEHALESEADVMGMRAAHISSASSAGISAAPATLLSPPSLPPASSHHGEVRQLRLPSPGKLAALLKGPVDAAEGNALAHRNGLRLLLEAIHVTHLSVRLRSGFFDTETNADLLELVRSLLSDDPSLELKLPTFYDTKKETKSDEADRRIIAQLVSDTDWLFGQIESSQWNEELENAFPQDMAGEDRVQDARDNYRSARKSMNELYEKGCIFIDRSDYLRAIDLAGFALSTPKEGIVLQDGIIANHEAACLTLLHESMHIGGMSVEDTMYPSHPDFDTLDTYGKLCNASHYEVVPAIILEVPDAAPLPVMQDAPMLSSLPHSMDLNSDSKRPANPSSASAQSPLHLLISPSSPATQSTSPLHSTHLDEDSKLPVTPSPDDWDTASASESDTEWDESHPFNLAHKDLFGAYNASLTSYSHLMTLHHDPHRWSLELKPSLNALSVLMALTIHQKPLIDPERKSPYFDPVSEIDLALAEGITRKLLETATCLCNMNRRQIGPMTKENWIEKALRLTDRTGDIKNVMKMVNELDDATEELQKHLDIKPQTPLLRQTPSGEPPKKRSRSDGHA